MIPTSVFGQIWDVNEGSRSGTVCTVAVNERHKLEQHYRVDTTLKNCTGNNYSMKNKCLANTKRLCSCSVLCLCPKSLLCSCPHGPHYRRIVLFTGEFYRLTEQLLHIDATTGQGVASIGQYFRWKETHFVLYFSAIW